MTDYLGLSSLVGRVGGGECGGTHSECGVTRRRSLSSSSNGLVSCFSSDDDMERLRFDFKKNGIDSELDPAEDFNSCSGFQPFNPLSFLDKNFKSTGGAGTKKVGRRRISPDWCVFCKNNGEVETVYMSHVLKNGDGKVRCPILRKYTCPICGMNGDHAHTIKYCPRNREDRPNIQSTRTSTGLRPQ
ncbi:nanos homolog 1-like isoform X2 [Antedon mediterranea]